MNVFRFLEWPMYQEAKRLNRKIGKISQKFSIENKKKYYSQFNRAVLSISLNIAEGAGRYSDTEMCRFFDISLGSITEVVACADNLKDEEILTQSQFDEIYYDCQNIAKQIQAMKFDASKNPKCFKGNYKL